MEANMPKACPGIDWDFWREMARLSIAEARSKVVDGELYFISRHGGYFRPHAQGYTSILAHASLFTAPVARAYLDVEGLSVIPLSSVRDSLKDYLRRAEKDVAALRVLI